MPLANLSERFYQKFGHELVEELVTWLNQMDTTYRADLRELNELNFARFDAKLEQRSAELNASIDQLAARFDAKLEQRIAEVKADLRLEIAGLRSELRQEIDGVKVIMSKQRADLITWMFVFWAGTVVPLTGLMFALFNHFRP